MKKSVFVVILAIVAAVTSSCEKKDPHPQEVTCPYLEAENLKIACNFGEKDTEGTGLGLYIVKAIIDQAGGKIWFESEENKGTTFFVEMPLTGMKKKEGTKAIE